MEELFALTCIFVFTIGFLYALFDEESEPEAALWPASAFLLVLASCSTLPLDQLCAALSCSLMALGGTWCLAVPHILRPHFLTTTPSLRALRAHRRTQSATPGFCYTTWLRDELYWLGLRKLRAYPAILTASRFLTHPGPAALSRAHLVHRRRRGGWCLTYGALSDLLSTPLGTAACGPELRAYLARANATFATSHAFSEQLTTLMASFGIARNPHGREHPHGAHKALEDKMHELAWMAVKGRQYTLLSRKPSTAPLARNATYQRDRKSVV